MNFISSIFLEDKNQKRELINTLLELGISGKELNIISLQVDSTTKKLGLFCLIESPKITFRVYDTQPPEEIQEQLKKILFWLDYNEPPEILKEKIKKMNSEELANFLNSHLAYAVVKGFKIVDFKHENFVYFPLLNKIYKEFADYDIENSYSGKDLDKIDIYFSREKGYSLRINDKSPDYLKKIRNIVLGILDNKKVEDFNNFKIDNSVALFKIPFNGEYLSIYLPKNVLINCINALLDGASSGGFLLYLPQIRKKLKELIEKEGIFLDEPVALVGSTSEWYIYQGKITKFFYKMKKWTYYNHYEQVELSYFPESDISPFTKEDLNDPEIAQIILKHTLLQ